MKKKPLILIVEDEIDQIEPISSYFTRRGFSILCTKDADEALSIIKEKRPDVVLMDLTLDSTLSGKTILEKLRTYDKETKVIVLTGNLRIEDKEVESIRSIGISEFLYKPVVLSNLENIIKSLLGIEHLEISSPKPKPAQPHGDDASVSSLIHDLSNSLGVIRNKCENFTLNLEDGIYKNKSDKELLKMATEIMHIAIKAVDRTTEVVQKISHQIKNKP